MSGGESQEKKDNFLTAALKRAYATPTRDLPPGATSGRGLGDPAMQRLAASYKPPIESQIGQIDRGEAWWRDFAWEEYATKDLPGLGLGFTVYPYVAVWEKIWGAVPTEDYNKYKQYYVQEPFIRATIDFHTQMTISQGYELDYPLDTVVKDVKAFLDRHDFINLLKIMVKDMLVFGNSYTEVVRTWYCHETGHDLASLRISYETTSADGETRYWWTDRLDVAAKHNQMYPTHKLENPYGEITRFKPLDPMYMRVRRDAYGSILGYVQYYVFPLVTFLADEMIHLRYMPTSWTYESVYGVSMLRPILFHQELMKNYEQTMGAIMNVFLKPMFLVHVGGPNDALGGADVSTAQFNQVRRYFQTSQPGQSIVIRAASPVEVKPIDPPIDRMQTTAFWLQWLHNMRTYALSVPKFFTDPAGLNRATAQCYSADTKVLTENGWKYHYEIGANEKIMVFEPTSNKMWLEIPKFLFAADYEGDMIHFKSDRTDLLVTPDHTIPYKWQSDNPIWKVDTASNLMEKSKVILPASATWANDNDVDFVEIPETTLIRGTGKQVVPSITIAMDNMLAFAGYYLSEGHMNVKTLGQIGITQKLGETATLIDKTIGLIPFHSHKYVEKTHMAKWSINGKQLGRFVFENFGAGSNDKFISSLFKNVSVRQLHILLDAMMRGDGQTIIREDNKVYRVYTTLSKRLAEDVAEIGVKTGFYVNLTSYERDGRFEYQVRMKESTQRTLRREQITKESYNGLVYCFNTSSGFYITMREGKVSYVGNTVEKGYFTFINSNRQSLNSQLESSIMQMVLKSLYGKIADEIIHEYGVPKFIWKPVKEDSLEDKAKTYLPLYASRILTKNEVRKALGFEPLDEEELVEEVGESEPPLGQVGAPGVTRAGTPTFGSPDETMASRPAINPEGGGEERQPTPEAELETAQDIFESGRHEQEEDLDDLADELDELKRTFQKKLEEAENETNQRPKRESL